jgi:hypothetical protein
MDEQERQQLGDTLIRAGCGITAAVAFVFFAFVALVWVLAVLR